MLAETTSLGILPPCVNVETTALDLMRGRLNEDRDGTTGVCEHGTQSSLTPPNNMLSGATQRVHAR